MQRKAAPFIDDVAVQIGPLNRIARTWDRHGATPKSTAN
jgi:hypothetical protein